jgi:NAD(P)-dependent dehydrogenase (short-subunit alcohol dehydrogenase family)/acyl carrier protein
VLVEAKAQPEQADSSTSVTEALMTLVSERTGYPAEMLNVDSDLEAELSIDSIKRIEILGALLQRLKIAATGAAADFPMEKLSALKTLRAIASFIEARLSPTAASGTSSQAVSTPALPAPNGARPPEESRAQLQWTAVRWEAAASASARSLSGKRFWLASEATPVGRAIAAALTSAGASAWLDPSRPTGPFDGLVELGGLQPGHAALWSEFLHCREAILAGATELWALSALGDSPSDAELSGAGTAGLLRAFAQEQPSLRTAVVDIESRMSDAEIAAALLTEMATSSNEREVAISKSGRRGRHLVASVSPQLGVELDHSSVVVLTGGARGITAALAVALAKRFKCRIELVGRRPIPETEVAGFAAAIDLPQLRRALIAAEQRLDVGGIESKAQELWAAREARRTLAAIREAGGEANYHAVDLRDPRAAARLIDELTQRHGRLDALFHGAGVTDDRGFQDKREEAFRRVIETKVGGAPELLRHLPKDTKLVALFGSVSGVFGNRGQTDYAAANDALDRLAWCWRDRLRGTILSLDFGPWSGAGMVTPELAREYARRGIPTIPLDEGIEALMTALFSGPARPLETCQLLFTAGPPQLFDQGARDPARPAHASESLAHAGHAPSP